MSLLVLVLLLFLYFCYYCHFFSFHRETYQSPYSRQTPAPSFYGDDPWEDSASYNSLDRREYAVSRAVERLAHDRERRQGVSYLDNSLLKN